MGKKIKTTFYIPVIIEIDATLSEREQKEEKDGYIQDLVNGTGWFRISGIKSEMYRKEVTKKFLLKSENYIK